MQTPVRSKDRFLVFGAPDIGEEEIAEVVATLRSGWLGTGPRTHRFESDFREHVRASHAIAVNSGTAALHLSMLAAGLGPGDEVITSALTFCATVNAIIHSGATPVLADVEPATMNIDPQHVAAKITPRTRAIVPVHFAGRPCAMDPIMELARRHGLAVIEDCAHAIETEYHGRKAGTFGDLGCFSFYVTKNVISGEGGMVVTSRADYAERIKVLGLHGMSRDAWSRFSDEGYRHYLVTEAGFKYNMMDLQAAIAIHQLARVERNWLRRSEIWKRYNEAFAEMPITTPAKPEPDTRHAFHLYTILVDEARCGVSRDEFLERMTLNHVGVGVHYLSVPEHPFYRQSYGFTPEDYPNAMRIGRQTASLPLSVRLSEGDVADVIETVRRIVAGN